MNKNTSWPVFITDMVVFGMPGFLFGVWQHSYVAGGFVFTAFIAYRLVRGSE